MYCDFHKYYGHISDEYRHLAQEIERVIEQYSGMKAILSDKKKIIGP